MMKVPRTGFKLINLAAIVTKSEASRERVNIIGINKILNSFVATNAPINTAPVATKDKIPVAEDSLLTRSPINSLNNWVNVTSPTFNIALKIIELRVQSPATQNWPVISKSKSMKIRINRYEINFPILNPSNE